MSIPRRLGRLARGFFMSLQDDDRFQQTLRIGRERGETLRESFGEAFGAAWRGATEEWRTAEEETASEERGRERGPGSRRGGSTTFIPRKYPLKVLSAYRYLGLEPGVSVEEVHRRRRDLIKRHHPDRFSEPEKRAKAEDKAARINSAHDAIVRHARGT